jgi:hypothetical protein
MWDACYANRTHSMAAELRWLLMEEASVSGFPIHNPIVLLGHIRSVETLQITFEVTLIVYLMYWSENS